MNKAGVQEPLLDEEQRQEVVAGYAAGASIYDLALAYKVAPTTIRRYLPDEGRRRPGFTQKGGPTSVIVELRQRGFTWDEIGPAVDLPPNTAARRYARWLKRGE